MNDKLKRLAKSISELLPDNPKNPQNVFDSFSNNVYESQKDYFNALGSDSIIKIILYIYSLKETGEFKMGDNNKNDKNNEKKIKISDKKSIHHFCQ